jgi:hypothetical protein
MSGGDLVWLPWVVLLAALALAGAWWASRRGDAPAALRRLGYAVGVLGLWGLGVPTLLARLWSTLSSWVARLVFNPLSWLGLVATVVAVLLVLAGLAWGRRREGSAQPRAVRKSSSKAVAASSSSSSEDEEIEALLRKHGTS